MVTIPFADVLFAEAKCGVGTATYAVPSAYLIDSRQIRRRSRSNKLP